MRFPLRAAVSCGLALLLAGSCFAQAGPQASARAGISKLFEHGTKNTPKEVAAARAQYQALAKSHPDDLRIDYAYTLVLLNQHRYKDALPLVTEYLARNPRDKPALRAKIWAELNERRYASALDDAMALVSDAPKTAAGQAELAESASFLGTVFGYLELTRPEAIGGKLLAARRDGVVSALDDECLAAFDEGRAVVADRLAALQDHDQARQDRATAALDQRKQQTSAALEENKQQAAVSKQQAASSAEQVRDAERGLTLAQHQMRSLVHDRARLSAQIFAGQTQLAEFYRKVAEENDENSNKRTPATQAILPNGQRVSYGLLLQMTTLTNTLSILNAQALDLDKRILSLESQSLQLQAKGTDESQTLTDSQATARQSEKRASLLEKQVRRFDTVQTSRAGALTAEMKRLSTYLPFPYEAETKRVLGWFQN